VGNKIILTETEMKNIAPEGRDGENKKPALPVYSECDFVHSFTGEGIIKTTFKKRFTCLECNQSHYQREISGKPAVFTVETRISDVPTSYYFAEFIEAKIKAGNQLNLAL
jgi:hypothetical protein